MIFSENQLTKFSAIEIIRINKSDVTNWNVGTQNNLRAKRAEKFFCTPRFVQLLLEHFLGVKADPPDKFQWGGHPHAVGVKPPTPGKSNTGPYTGV